MKTSEILETTDLSIFKKHYENRDVDAGHVHSLVISFKERNLFDIRPILVDTDMCVLDGQNRLAAAKELGLPVCYQIVDDPKSSELIYVLNAKAQKPWSRADYLNYWCQKRNDNYLKLRDFMKAKGIGLPVALSSLGQHSGGLWGDNFRHGKFLFPKNIDAIDEVFVKAGLVTDFITQKATSRKGVAFIYRPRFTKALQSFLAQNCVDVDIFLKKLSYNLQRIRSCSVPGDYTRIFISIYNWMNKEPIPSDAL